MLDFTDAMDMNLSKLWEMVRGREACCAAVHGGGSVSTELKRPDSDPGCPRGDQFVFSQLPASTKLHFHWRMRREA